MAVYAKFIAVVIGMVVLGVKQLTGFDIGDDFTQKVTDVIVMVVTALSVYQVPNKQQ